MTIKPFPGLPGFPRPIGGPKPLPAPTWPPTGCPGPRPQPTWPGGPNAFTAKAKGEAAALQAAGADLLARIRQYLKPAP